MSNLDERAIYKGQQSFVLTYDNVPQNIFINSKVPIDKLRISCFDRIDHTEINHLLVIWSDLVDNYIGTICESVDINGISAKTFSPQLGMEYFFPNKILLEGSYVVKPLNVLFGLAPPNTAIAGVFMVVVEYFTYE